MLNSILIEVQQAILGGNVPSNKDLLQTIELALEPSYSDVACV